MDESIGGLFFPVKAYLGIRKAGLAMQLGTEGGTSVALIEQSAHCLVESSVKKAFLSTIQADLCCTPLFTMRYDWM
jgi:hypothetical protein